MMLAVEFTHQIAGLSLGLAIILLAALTGFAGWELRHRLTTQRETAAALEDLQVQVTRIDKLVPQPPEPGALERFIAHESEPPTQRHPLVHKLVAASLAAVEAEEALSEGRHWIRQGADSLEPEQAIRAFDRAKDRLDALPSSAVHWGLSRAPSLELDLRLVAELFDARDDVASRYRTADRVAYSEAVLRRQEELRKGARRWRPS